jgi:hypothetical protein
MYFKCITGFGSFATTANTKLKCNTYSFNIFSVLVVYPFDLAARPVGVVYNLAHSAGHVDIEL